MARTRHLILDIDIAFRMTTQQDLYQDKREDKALRHKTRQHTGTKNETNTSHDKMGQRQENIRQRQHNKGNTTPQDKARQHNTRHDKTRRHSITQQNITQHNKGKGQGVRAHTQTPILTDNDKDKEKTYHVLQQFVLLSIKNRDQRSPHFNL